MKTKSLTIIRNSKIVGNNSKSYDAKHQSNPVDMRPIYNAIQDTPKILDSKNRFVPDVKKIRFLKKLSNLPRIQISFIIANSAH